MRGGYTAERYLARLAEARAAIPDLAVTTDVIVGFPGETEDDFERTLEVVAEVGYDDAYTFIFSPGRALGGGLPCKTVRRRTTWWPIGSSAPGGGGAIGAGPPPKVGSVESKR